MYFIYSLLFSLALLLFLPQFLYQALRHRKYITGLKQRFGFVPTSRGTRPVIWLHCVSVGEVMAAKPFAQTLMTEYEDFDLVVSTTTVTGQRIAQDIFRDLAQSIFFFPLDLPWTIRAAVTRIRPALLLLMETEIWPQLIRVCHRKQIPIAIINGRISPVSFRRYQSIKRFLARTLNQLSMAVMQTDEDADRLKQLGISSTLIHVSGNLKFDAPETDARLRLLSDSLGERYNLSPTSGRPLIVAASTHPTEEKILLAAYRLLRTRAPNSKARLLIAPRHPERFTEVARLLASAEFTHVRRSSASEASDQQADIILLDSIGELRAVYSLAPIVFVGGSIAPTGGHNILEPALESCCIITGPHTANFASITKTFVEAQAIIQLSVMDDEKYSEVLAENFIALLDDEDLRSAYGAKAHRLIKQHRGASHRTLEFLKPLIENRQ